MKQIVVTGASGTIGRRVLDGLVAAGASVTALTHSPDKTTQLEALGVRAAVGSFEDRASLERAFAGADTVVLITASNGAAEAQASNSIDAAVAAKVRKVVRISALKADPDGPTDNTRQHGRTEAKLRASGLTYVILRPHLFMQNLFGSLQSIQQSGKLFWGAGDGRMGMIDTRDISDAAIVVATSDRFDGETLELTGPASIDYHQVAAAIGRGLGREVTYVPVPAAAAGEAVRNWGGDDWMVGVVRDYATAYARNWGDFTTDEVARITGHPARSIDDFVREVLAPAAAR